MTRRGDPERIYLAQRRGIFRWLVDEQRVNELDAEHRGATGMMPNGGLRRTAETIQEPNPARLPARVGRHAAPVVSSARLVSTGAFK